VENRAKKVKDFVWRGREKMALLAIPYLPRGNILTMAELKELLTVALGVAFYGDSRMLALLLHRCYLQTYLQHLVEYLGISSLSCVTILEVSELEKYCEAALQILFYQFSSMLLHFHTSFADTSVV